MTLHRPTAPTIPPAQRLTLLVLLFALSIVSMLAWLNIAGSRCIDDCLNTHTSMLSGTALAPFRYRLFAPFMAASVSTHPLTGYMILHIAGVFALLLGLYRLTRGLTAPLIAIAYLPLMYGTSWGWVGVMTVIEAATWAWALVLLSKPITRPRLLLYGILVLIGTLNREMAVFLVVLFGLVTRRVGMTFVLALLWAAVYGALRLGLGAAAEMITPAQALAQNLGGGWHTQWAILNNALLLPLWVYAALRGRNEPPFIRRALWIIPPYLVAVLSFGLWNEVRLLLPLFPLVLICIEKPTTNRMT